jgi:hypothetical protein
MRQNLQNCLDQIKENSRAITLLREFLSRSVVLFKAPRIVAQASSLWDRRTSCLSIAQTLAGRMPASPTAKMAVLLLSLNADSLSGRPTFRFGVRREILGNL